jgi:hypothetical protein
VTRDRWVALIRDRLIFVKIAVVLLWLTWIVTIALSGFRRDIKGDPLGTDHIAFYAAARFIDEGRGVSIYDHAAVSQYQTEVSGKALLDAYRNPPFYALMYIPTSRLPYLASFWIWTIISVLLLWFGIRWLGSTKPATAFIYAFSFYPVFAVFSFGQNSLLSFGIFCLTFYLLRHGLLFWAGVASGLLLFKPQLLIGLGIWWLLSLRSYWKCLAGLSLMAVILAAISILVVPDETKIFIEKLREIAGYDAFNFWNLHNPRAFATLIAFDNKQVGTIVGLAFSVIAIACFVWFWRQHRDNMPVMFAAAVFLTLWASPHTMIYEWTLAIIPAVLLWEYVKEKRDDWILIFAVSWIALFISTPIARGLFEWTVDKQTGRDGWAIQISVPVMAIVAVWTARVLRDRPGTSLA